MNDHDPDADLRLILRALELDFGVGVAPAAGLQGDALRAWIAAADNALFGCQNCCTQAQLTPPVVSVRGAEGGASALTADFSGNTQDSRFASRLLGGAPYL